jgi:hypothetical protein
MASQAPPGHRSTSLVLDPELAAWVDTQARRYGISKAGYMRLLIVQAMDHQAAGAMRAG